MTAHVMTETSLADIIAHVQVGTGEPMKLMFNLLKNLATKVDKLQEEVTLLKAANTELRGNNIGNNNNTSANFWNQLSNNTKAMNAIKSMASTENNNIQRKEKNLIITEKKPEEDVPRKLKTGKTQEIVKSEVEKILTAVGMERHKDRIKMSRNKEDGPILLVFEDRDSKIEVLKASKELKGKSELDTIYINNDRTEAEIENEKKLRVTQLERNTALTKGLGFLKYETHMCSDGTERKWWWGIRGGELRRIYGNL